MSNTINQRKIHFTGVGGIGMSALAQLLAERGDVIVGTDREASPVTEMLEKKRIKVLIGQRSENVAEDTAILVYSDAVPTDNPERARAFELDIPQRSYFEMLGGVSEEKRTIAIAGTNGKTTTSGMLARILRDAGVSPMAVIGSIVQDFGSNYLAGESEFFVVEACEYQRHFLNLSAEVLVVTNIEFDHTDYFNDLADVQDAFRTMMEKVPAHGYIVTDAEHPNIQPLLANVTASVVDYTAMPRYELRLIGEFNEMNARAAAAAARAVAPDILESSIVESLREFHGTWRRFEYKGKMKNGSDIYDDYAHHPTAIKETLRAMKGKALTEHKEENKGEKGHGRIIVAFHPHLYSRTRDLLDGFARAFSDADEVLIAPIYAAREIDDGTISSEMLAERIRAEGVHARALDTFEEIEHVIREEATSADTVVTMGAGDIYKVADALIA